MGREQRKNELETLKEQMKACNEDLRYLNAMRRIQTSDDYRNSIGVLIDGFEHKIHNELVDETAPTNGGKDRRNVEPAEALMKIKVYNRLMAFISQFKNLDRKIEEAENALQKAEQDFNRLNEE